MYYFILPPLIIHIGGKCGLNWDCEFLCMFWALIQMTLELDNAMIHNRIYIGIGRAL
jgi:hypothetical protein